MANEDISGLGDRLRAHQALMQAAGWPAQKAEKMGPLPMPSGKKPKLSPMPMPSGKKPTPTPMPYERKKPASIGSGLGAGKSINFEKLKESLKRKSLPFRAGQAAGSVARGAVEAVKNAPSNLKTFAKSVGRAGGRLVEGAKEGFSKKSFLEGFFDELTKIADESGVPDDLKKMREEFVAHKEKRMKETGTPPGSLYSYVKGQQKSPRKTLNVPNMLGRLSRTARGG